MQPNFQKATNKCPHEKKKEKKIFEIKDEHEEFKHTQLPKVEEYPPTLHEVQFEHS